MSDILSGGRIDESTSGPIPSKEDDRKRDILAEQRENQRQDAIGGTEEPPKPRPAEQIPEPPQVAPPLPVIPAFDFSIAGSALEETREVARQTVFDVMRNVTINGQGPSIEGSTISFNIPQQPPASEVFLFQGVAIPQSQIPQIIQPPAIPQPQIQQPEPAQEIQSVVIAPPSRTRAPQVEVITEEQEEVQAPQQPAPVTPPQGLVSAPVELEEPVSVTPPPELRAPSARMEAPEIEPQEPIRIPSERVVTVPTLEVEIPTVEVSEQRIEEPKILTAATISIETAEPPEEPTVVTSPSIAISPRTEEVTIEQVAVMAPQLQPVTQEETQVPQLVTTPTISVAVPPQEQPEAPTPLAPSVEQPQEIQSTQTVAITTAPIVQPQEEIEQPRIVTTPTVSVVSPQEEEPVEQPRITTTPSISITVPQEEAEQPQEPTPQPARSVSVQVPQAEATEAEEPQVPVVSSTQQQPVRLEVPEPETTSSIPEAPEQIPPQEGGRVVPIQTVDILQTEEPVEQPRIVTTPSIAVAEPQEDQQQQRGESIGEQRDRENTEREARNQAIRTSLGLDAVSPLDRPSETVTSRGEPIGEQRERESAERAQRDREIRVGIGLDPEIPMDQESDSAKAYKAAEARSKERRESDPDFDRESDIRQRGETPKEFRERQEQLKEEREGRIEAAKEKSDFIKRAREGDLTEAPSGIVPVEFTRADGERKILAFIATEFVATTEGAVEGERATTLPAEDSYFLGGGGGGGSVPPHPWQIKLRTVPETDPPEYEFKVEAASRLYEGLENWSDIEVSGLNEWFSILDGEYIILNGTVENGACTEAEILKTDTLPDRIVFEDDEQTEFNTQLGFIFSQGEQLRVRQNAFHNFTLIQNCINDKIAIYPFAT
jgi:hypothetical protein